MEPLFRKKISSSGRVRYEEVGPDFAGFPADGVWLVRTTKNGRGYVHIGKECDLPAPSEAARLYQHLDDLARGISKSDHGAVLDRYHQLYRVGSLLCKESDLAGDPRLAQLQQALNAFPQRTLLESCWELARKMLGEAAKTWAVGLEPNPFEGAEPGRVFVKKPWGWEWWVVNTEDYCGKVLFVEKHKYCSWHFHMDKDETFLVWSGRLSVLTTPLPEPYSRDAAILALSSAKEKKLSPWDTLRVLPETLHRFTAEEDCFLFEFSTHHEDSDSYRVLPGSHEDEHA